jgi:TFIIS helical bundle-like domain
MFLSKSDEETTANRKLAKELVDKWVSVYPLCTIKIYYLCALLNL